MENFSFDQKKNKSGKDILPFKQVNNENINPKENFHHKTKFHLGGGQENNINNSQNEKFEKNELKKHKPQSTLRFFGKNLLNKNPIFETIKSNLLSPRNIKLEECEKKVKNNPQYLIEYSNEILFHLKKTENINLPDYSTYFIQKTTISEKSRRILLDWIISVHFKFDLLPETLYLTVNLIDRMISLNQITLEKFQLLGVTAMLIASKYEEIYAPEIRDFIYVTGKTVTKKDILEMEFKILSLLKFDILIVSPYTFLNRLHFISNTDEQTYYLAMMLIEISFLDINFLKHPPSLISASLFYLARKIIKKFDNGALYPIWNDSLKFHSGYNESTLKICIKEFAEFYKNNMRNSKLEAVLSKFSSEKFNRVSKKFFNSK